MIWISFTIICACLIGAFSFKYEKLFVAACVASAPIIGLIIMRVVIPFASALPIIPANRPGDVPFEKSGLDAVIEFVLFTPSDIKWALYLFPFFFLAARIVTWLAVNLSPEEEIILTREQRKQSILSEYEGYDF